jgi:hypothetical protein
MKILLSNKTYDILKWVCLIALPAVSAFYGVIAKIWGLPFEHEIVLTIDAVGVLIGSLIGISTAQYNKKA